VGNNPTTLTDRLGLGPTACLARSGSVHGHVSGSGCAGVYEGGGGGVSVDGGYGYPPGLFGSGGTGLGGFGAGGLGGGESAVQCPGNICVFYQFGLLVQYSAFAGSAAAIDGYYSNWGPGGIYSSPEQAGIASSEWGASYLQQTGSEVGGSLWCEYGVCSSTLNVGAPGAGLVYMDGSTDFSDVLGGSSNGEGWWRATNGESPSQDLSNVNSWNSALGTSLPQYTGTTSGVGRVLVYWPSVYGPDECVLTGGLWWYGSEGYCP
jgi:hypothetical protein